MTVLHVERWGSGQREVLGLHGWAGTHAAFAALAPLVGARDSLFAADLPGCGRSAPALAGRGVLSLDAVIEPLLAWLARRPAPVILAGNCSGAVFAVALAARLPEQVRRLVLIDPFAYVPWYFRLFLVPSFGRLAYLSTFANPLGRWLTNGALRRRRAPGSDLTAGFRAVDHESTFAYLRLLAELGSPGRLLPVGARAPLRFPVLLAHGERTFAAVRRSVPLWRQLLPQTTVRVLAGAGHFPITEATAELARLILEGDGAGDDAP